MSLRQEHTASLSLSRDQCSAVDACPGSFDGNVDAGARLTVALDVSMRATGGERDSDTNQFISIMKQKYR
jgi:hypothetical protein